MIIGSALLHPLTTYTQERSSLYHSFDEVVHLVESARYPSSIIRSVFHKMQLSSSAIQLYNSILSLFYLQCLDTKTRGTKVTAASYMKYPYFPRQSGRTASVIINRGIHHCVMILPTTRAISPPRRLFINPLSPCDIIWHHESHLLPYFLMELTLCCSAPGTHTGLWLTRSIQRYSCQRNVRVIYTEN